MNRCNRRRCVWALRTFPFGAGGAACLATLGLLAAISALAGCGGGSAPADTGSEWIVPSAAEHYEDVLQTARDWKSDAHLISISLSAALPSSRVGPWISYYFESPSTGSSFFEVRFMLGEWTSEVLHKGPMALTSLPIQREDWLLDSIDAWRIALANGGRDFLLHYQDQAMSKTVGLDHWRAGTEQERLAWRVDFFIVLGPSLDIFIDPENGDIIEAEEHSMSGTLVATTPTLPSTPWAPLPVCTPATPGAGLATGLPERIAFESTRDGMKHIYLMDPDGTDIVQLTEGPGAESDAAWSPDGRRIAFTGSRGTDLDIYVIDADGSNLQRLTEHPGYDREPTWSPDGNRIAFSSDRDGNDNLYVMDADGSNLALLTDHALADGWPDWSPDGCRIAFSSERDHWPDPHIYVISSDGSDVVQLTDGPSRDFRPRWSPDGKRIAFRSSPMIGVEGGPDIYVMDQDGSNRIRLTAGPCGGPDLAPVPDGVLTKIAVWSLPITQELARRDSEVIGQGSASRQALSSGPCYGSNPVWSPDGRRIAFSVAREDPLGSDIFLMEADGSNVVQLTNDASYNVPCSWRP
jgi:hypothetical protein